MASILTGFTLEDLDLLITTNPYLRGFIQGYLAELRLQQHLLSIPNVEAVTKIPDSETRKGDFEVIYLGTPITIECKSIQTSSVRSNPMHDSWIGTVLVKNSDRRILTINGEPLNLVNLEKGTFDILAISCFAVNNSWDFLFIENKYLAERADLPGIISSKITLDPSSTAGITENVESLLHKAYLNKTSKAC